MKIQDLHVTFAAIAMLAAVALASPQKQGEAARTVIVMVTTRGITLSQREVKPGKVRFLVENYTPRPSLDLEVNAVLANGSRGAAVASEKAESSPKSKRSWFEATMTPGSYKLGLTNMPGLEVEIKVQP